MSEVKPRNLLLRLFRAIDASRLQVAERPYRSLLVIDQQAADYPDELFKDLFTTETPITFLRGDADIETWVAEPETSNEHGYSNQAVGVLVVDKPREYPTMTEIKQLLQDRFGSVNLLNHTQTVYVVESYEIDPAVAQETVTVEVTGPTQSGKTVVTAIIAQALRQHGFDNVDIACQDGDVSHKYGFLSRGDVTDLFAPKPVPRVQLNDRNLKNKTQ